ncbi:MAG: IS66 family insertion sequence element accessory protein TnpA [Peptococcales bacterium]|jgi:hypothetical protein
MPKANTELRKKWESRVAAFKASGQSSKEWCEVNNLKINQLRYWVRKLRSTNEPTMKSPQWLSVELDKPEASIQNNSLIVRVGKVSIEVKSGFDPSLLSDVVKTLTDI